MSFVGDISIPAMAIASSALTLAAVAIDKYRDSYRARNFVLRKEAQSLGDEEITAHYDAILGYFSKKRDTSKNVNHSPPRVGRFIIRIFTSYKEHEALLGDLSEMYFDVLKEDGPRVAALFYYSQALRSVLAQLKRPVLISTVAEFIRRNIS